MNEYQRVGADAQTHDANGNVQSDGSQQYQYDALNRLVRVSTSDGQLLSRYRYDAYGRRISTTTEAAQTRFIYFGKQVLEERDGSEAMLRQYVYGDGVDDLLQMRTSANEQYYYHDDALGSITAITDSNGAVVERYDYDAYGALRILDETGQTERSTSLIQNSYTYTGRRYDTETGLYYYRARYYSPEHSANLSLIRTRVLA